MLRPNGYGARFLHNNTCNIVNVFRLKFPKTYFTHDSFIDPLKSLGSTCIINNEILIFWPKL